ncbi:protein of unknown function [Tepidibacter aestuarii]|nr:protein of unknown function [Tepidibacter aestuarii]
MNNNYNEKHGINGGDYYSDVMRRGIRLCLDLGLRLKRGWYSY